jgi:hypothetical protein
MLAKGKTPKVSTALARVKPVANNPEGILAARPE